MDKENIIRCPECGAEIDVNDVLYHQLEEQIKKDFAKQASKKDREFQSKLKEFEIEKGKFEKEKDGYAEQLEKEVNQKIKLEKQKLEKSLRQNIEEEKSEQIGELKKELQEKSTEVKELNKTKAEVERLKREKEEQGERIALEKEKEFGEKLKEAKNKIKTQVEGEHDLKLKEKEKLIEDLKDQLTEAKRKAEQGSVQSQGEIQELVLEDMLRNLYQSDEIKEIKKGQKGADVLQIVKKQNGTKCGKIYYESKRTKGFQNSWIKKLKDDNLEHKADILILVSETLPDTIDKFGFKEGVWICSLNEVKGLSLALRYTLLRLFEANIIQQGRGDKKELLYDYMTSQEFRGQFEAIIEGFVDLQHSYIDEKAKMQRIWKEREKQLEKIVTNTVEFYGSLRGIAGKSIPQIQLLESGSNNLIEDGNQNETT